MALEKINQVNDIKKLEKYEWNLLAEEIRQFLIEKILLSVPQDILREQISQELFERDYTQIEELIRDYKRKHQGSW